MSNLPANAVSWESAAIIFALAFLLKVVIGALRRSDIEQTVERTAESVKQTVREEVIKANHVTTDFMENTPTPMWYKDRRYIMRWVNNAYSMTFGILRSNYVGKTDYDVWPAEIARAFRTHDEEVLLKGVRIEVVEDVPVRIGDPDSPLKQWRVVKFPHRNPITGDVEGVCGEAHPVNGPECVSLPLPGHELVTFHDGRTIHRPTAAAEADRIGHDPELPSKSDAVRP